MYRQLIKLDELVNNIFVFAMSGMPVLKPSEKAIKEIFASKKDRERCRREVTCRHVVILKREIKTLQKTFVVNGIRDKTLNPFSLDWKSLVNTSTQKK
jgi:hypothetical protein